MNISEYKYIVPCEDIHAVQHESKAKAIALLWVKYGQNFYGLDDDDLEKELEGMVNPIGGTIKYLPSSNYIKKTYPIRIEIFDGNKKLIIGRVNLWFNEINNGSAEWNEGEKITLEDKFDSCGRQVVIGGKYLVWNYIENSRNTEVKTVYKFDI